MGDQADVIRDGVKKIRDKKISDAEMNASSDGRFINAKFYVEIYDINCGKCNEKLKFNYRLDAGGDLRITAFPCNHCLNEKYCEGEQAGMAIEAAASDD